MVDDVAVGVLSRSAIVSSVSPLNLLHGITADGIEGGREPQIADGVAGDGGVELDSV